MTRRVLLLGGLSAFVLVAAALAFSPLRLLIDDPADGEPVRGVSTVSITGREFSPPVVVVPAGTTVTWEFRHSDDGEPVAHNVEGPGFRSPDLQTGRYRRTFDRPGSFRYSCDLHTGMRGRVDVVPRPTAGR